MSQIMFVFNPKSNDGKSRAKWVKLQKKYPDQLPQSPVDITRTKELAALIDQKKPKIVAIAGGDGTVNKVCQEVLKAKNKPTLAVLPLGFGNALAYCLGVDKMDQAIKVLFSDKSKKVTIDIMQTSLPKYPIGIFNIGVGFDANIVHSRRRYKRYIGVRSYLISAIRSFLSHKRKNIFLTIDNKVEMQVTTAALVIANCPIIGKNYTIAPHAKLNDGLLDCTIFPTKYDYITNLRIKGFKHPLYSEKDKIHFKASKIHIEGESLAQVDGDPDAQHDGIDIEVQKQCLTFLRNEDSKISLEYIPYN